LNIALEEVIARVPLFAGRQDLVITQLQGGITNLNYRVDTGMGSYVLRVTGIDTDLLGISRKAEFLANQAAGRLGIAPEVIFFLQPEGYLVTRYINGKNVTPEAMREIGNLRRFVDKVRRFHKEAPYLPVEFNVFRRIERLADVAQSQGCRFPPDIRSLLGTVHDVEETMTRKPAVKAPCHNDLLNLNFLDEAGELRILDWEYAGMGDVYFDLANFSHHHALNDNQMSHLLELYFGEVTCEKFARLKLMVPMSEIHEAMWGTVQTSISTLDEDFDAYATRWFGLAKSAISDPRWLTWMDTVGAIR
jgi:thiamine kinase-like enzyme